MPPAGIEREVRSGGQAPEASLAPWWSAGVLPGRWTPLLLLATVGLLLVSLLVSVSQQGLGVDFPGLDSLERWFNVDREAGVPAWFSTILLLLCAQQLWILARQSAAGNRQRWSRHERLLAVLFVFLSIDEMTQIHEQANEPLEALGELSPVLRFAWVAVAVPLVVVLSAFMLPYLMALPRAVRLMFMLSAAVYVGGALGTELIGAVIFSGGGSQSLLYSLVYTVEEGLEMLGLILFLGALYQLRRRTAPRFRVSA